MSTLLNANPQVYQKSVRDYKSVSAYDDNLIDAVTSEEIFTLIRNIRDPEHPLTLEQLNVAREDLIIVTDKTITVNFTPTIPHCSMATLIGLCIRVQLLRTLSRKYKIKILVEQGSHQSEDAVNKQLNDKERVAAAMENSHLLAVVDQCLAAVF
jgi:metal-sulfur cluster biosynthetic enzyme